MSDVDDAAYYAIVRELLPKTTIPGLFSDYEKRFIEGIVISEEGERTLSMRQKDIILQIRTQIQWNEVKAGRLFGESVPRGAGVLPPPDVPPALEGPDDSNALQLFAHPIVGKMMPTLIHAYEQALSGKSVVIAGPMGNVRLEKVQ